jgi:hypothetical protein
MPFLIPPILEFSGSSKFGFSALILAMTPSFDISRIAKQAYQERRDKKLKYLRRIGIRPTKEGKIKDFGKRDS